jgi:hypothetical protein
MFGFNPGGWQRSFLFGTGLWLTTGVAATGCADTVDRRPSAGVGRWYFGGRVGSRKQVITKRLTNR